VINIIKFFKCKPSGLQKILILYQNCNMGKLNDADIVFNQKIALRLKNLREEINLSQAQFAKKHNIDRQIISRWENTNDNRGISIHTIRRFCKLINISLKEFFDDKSFLET